MRVTTFVRAERAVYVLVDRKPVSEHSSREEAKREAARLAAWVDGPDSEAARAGRGEYRLTTEQNRAVHRALVESVEEGDFVSAGEPDYRAMWEELESRIPLVGDVGAGALRGAMAGICERHKRESRTPDPDHVPAVRRAVAWAGNDEEWPRTDIADAYMDAAHQLLVRAHVRRGCSWDRIERWWPEDRVQRLAAALRHRDEEAGHR